MIDHNLKVFNWNVCGLNLPARRETVLRMLHDHKPALVCLQETKLDNIDQRLASEFLGSRLSFEYLPAAGTQGGILIAWIQTCFLCPVNKKSSFRYP